MSAAFQCWRSSFSGISASMACALTSARARDRGDMRARSSQNFLAIGKPFLSQLRQMLLIEPVGDGNMRVVPTRVSCLVAADQQYRRPPRVGGTRPESGLSHSSGINGSQQMVQPSTPCSASKSPRSSPTPYPKLWLMLSTFPRRSTSAACAASGNTATVFRASSNMRTSASK